MDKRLKVGGWSGSGLKVVALVSMTIDHIACYLMADGMPYEVMRAVGRIAFPVFAFLLVEGFVHTHSRKAYALHLLAFALISQIPWGWLNHDNTHNVFFTLLLGLIALWGVGRSKGCPCLAVFVTVAVAAVATILHTDYEWHGVLLIVLFYLFRKQRLLMALFTIPVMAEYGLVGYLLALAVLMAYNGRRGFIKTPCAKYMFYAYYPLHLLVILNLIPL